MLQRLKVQTDLKKWVKQEELGMLAVSVMVKQWSGATSGLALSCCELGGVRKPGEGLLSACPIPCAFL